jgi:hypothetical protein
LVGFIVGWVLTAAVMLALAWIWIHFIFFWLVGLMDSRDRAERGKLNRTSQLDPSVVLSTSNPHYVL